MKDVFFGEKLKMNPGPGEYVRGEGDTSRLSRSGIGKEKKF